MKRTILPIILVALVGCATAPVSFCETAFPTKERIALTLGDEVNLNMKDWGSNQINNEMYPPSFGLNMFVLSASLSPIPILTLTPLYYAPNGEGWLIRGKMTLLSSESQAAALIFGGGTGQGDFSELDWWSGSGYVGEYSASTIQAGGIYSFGQASREDDFYSLNIGPKVIYTKLDYTDYHGEENKEFKGELWDFGFFAGVTGWKRFSSVKLRFVSELSPMLVDIPIPRSRDFSIRVGTGVGLSF